MKLSNSGDDLEPYDVDTHIPQQMKPEPWIKDLGLHKNEKKILESNISWLNDTLIDAGQKLLHNEFGDRIEGLQTVTLAQTLAFEICGAEFVQVLNKSESHWFIISTVGCKQPATVRVYDSASKYVTYRNKEEIASLLCTPKSEITLQYMNVQIQTGANDCGLFALANATALCHGLDPTSCVYNQAKMREHFKHCLIQRRMEPFPLQKKRRVILRPAKEENFLVYCHCRLPWDRHHDDDNMTKCDDCRGWFHDTCDLPQCNSQSQWFCKKCRKKSVN